MGGVGMGVEREDFWGDSIFFRTGTGACPYGGIAGGLRKKIFVF